MAGALVFLVGQLFLFGTTSAVCSTPCEECKIIPDGNYEGTWSLKSTDSPHCPGSCLYQKYWDGEKTEMCFCDPGPIVYESCKNQLVVTGGDGPLPFSSSEIIYYHSVCPSNIPPLPNKTSAGKSVWIHDSTLMFCGGSETFDGGAHNSATWGATEKCWKYSPGVPGWTYASTSDMNVDRSWFSLNNINANEAVAAGGLDNNGNVWDTLEKYSGGVWTVLPITLDKPTYGHCAVHYSEDGNSYLMIIGGSNTFDDFWKPSASVTQIDLSTGLKVFVAPGPLPALWAPACTILDDNIYVSGGGKQDGNNAWAIPQTDVYRYSLTTGLFTLQGNLNTPRWGATMGVVGENRLVVAGGFYKFGYLDTVESSDDGGATWNTWPTGLSQGAEYQAMASVPAVTFECQ